MKFLKQNGQSYTCRKQAKADIGRRTTFQMILIEVASDWCTVENAWKVKIRKRTEAISHFRCRSNTQILLEMQQLIYCNRPLKLWIPLSEAFQLKFSACIKHAFMDLLKNCFFGLIFTGRLSREFGINIHSINYSELLGRRFEHSVPGECIELALLGLCYDDG